MKSHKEMFEALLAGETLYYKNNDVECYLDNEGELIGYYRIEYLKTPNLWEIKSKTIMINGYEVPAPITEKDIECEDFHDYYVVDFTERDGVGRYNWNNDETDYRWLSQGIIHIDEENAKLHAKALLSFSEVKT